METGKTPNRTSVIVNIVIIVLAAIVALLFINFHKVSAPNKENMPEDTALPSEQADTVPMENWKTFSYNSKQLTFKYPESLSTTYIRTVEWPPKVQVITGSFACADAGEEGAQAGKTEITMINGREYCVTTVSEGAAGSTYTNYAYAREFDNKTLYFTFTLKSVQCGNYNLPEKATCDAERLTFKINQLMDQIIQTTTFS